VDRERLSAARTSEWYIKSGNNDYITIHSPQTNNPDHNLIIPNPYAPKAVWTQVNWDALDTVENAMSGSSNENSFSHWLFPYGDVEYYKEIANCPQFRPGWYDENLSYLTYDQLHSLTPESNHYENM